jgi:hypothetical protein
VQLIEVIKDVFNRPPIKFAPEKQSLKAWAMYCLRDRGFKVVYAQNADFAIEPRTGDKVYFKVTNSEVDLDKAFGWVVWDSSTNSVKVIAPQSS